MINFSINKAYFLQALNTTKRAISSKNAIPILSTIKIDVTTEGITLIGSNGQISIEHFISVKEENAGLLVTTPGAILLEAAFFINVVSSLPDVVVDFKEIEQKQIVLVSGKSEITLKGKDAEQYPRIQEIATSNPLILPIQTLKKIISETAFAASTQESRPIFTGVHLVLSDKKNLKAVATDSHRMSQRLLALENDGSDFDVVLPSKSIQSFKNVFTNDEEDLDISLANNQILFRNERISYYSRLIEGTYPDTNRLIPNEADYSLNLVFDVAALRRTMERARLLSNATANGTVKLTVSGDSVITTANSPEVGSVHEELTAIEKTGEDIAISFNPQYLIDALRVIKEPEVRIRFISNVRPFTLLPKNDTDSFVQLITPVRTN